MSFQIVLTLKRKAASSDMEYVRKLYDAMPEAPLGWKTYFDIWTIPRLKITLETGVESAIKELDAQAKGWKPVADGKETQYGIQGDHNEVTFWYQRMYEK